MSTSKCSHKMSETQNKNSKGGVFAEEKSMCWEGWTDPCSWSGGNIEGALGTLLRPGHRSSSSPRGAAQGCLGNLKPKEICCSVSGQIARQQTRSRATEASWLDKETVHPSALQAFCWAGTQNHCCVSPHWSRHSHLPHVKATHLDFRS